MSVFIIILFVFIFVAIVAGTIISKVKEDETPKRSSKNKKNIVEEFDLKVGDEVNLWPKPNSNEVHVFVKGTVGGSGRITTFTDRKIYKLAGEGEVYGKITSITDGNVKVEVFKYDD